MHHSFRDIEHMMAKLNTSPRSARGDAAESPALGGRSPCPLAYPFYFLKHYALRGYFRLGVYGLATAGVLAYGRWLRDAKMYERLLVERKPRGKQGRTPAGLRHGPSFRCSLIPSWWARQDFEPATRRL